MSVNLQLEHLYDRIDLVRGAGNPRHGRLCIMSFVAYLAGEPHGDRPIVASPIIRYFAIQLNDGAINEWRQELKPFAPRILGTNDGQELARGELLYRAIKDEILPTARAEFGPVREEDEWNGNMETSSTPYAPTAVVNGHEALKALMRHINRTYQRKDYLSLATWAGNLVVVLSRCGQSPSVRRWYWAKGLELLDRLCEVGAEQRVRSISEDRLGQLRTRAEGRRASKERIQGAVGEAHKARRTIPQLCKAALQYVL